MVGCIENVSGLSLVPKLRISSLFSGGVVEEHSICDEAGPERAGGVYGRENVGMSNRKQGEKPCRRKPKVSVAMSISHGLGGPKAMAKAVVDGQLVNIPALLSKFDGVTGEIRLSVLLVWHYYP